MVTILLITIAVTYMASLFLIAHSVERGRLAWLNKIARGPIVYSLSLVVYCTTWTFFGATGRAAQSGVEYLPTYAGPIAFFLFATPVLRKILYICKNQNITSISDFLSSRYGKCPYVAGLVALIALIGLIPYLALQIKATSMAFDLTRSYLAAGQAGHQTSFEFSFINDGLALSISASLAVFVVIFAKNTANANEKHLGLVLSTAFESVIKLVSFLILGGYVLYLIAMRPAHILEPLVIFDGLGEILNAEAMLEPRFWAMVLLSGLATLCLPRMFHMAFIENTDPGHLNKARFTFPLYLSIFAVFIPLIAIVGKTLFLNQPVNPDAYVLAIPMLTGNTTIVGLIFLGGLAAATGMIIIEALSLATMLCNDLALPFLLRNGYLVGTAKGDENNLIVKTRRIAIVAVMSMAYIYSTTVGSSSLVDIGVTSFVAVSQFSPLIIAGIYWPRANRAGAIAGLMTGSVVWLYMLFSGDFSEPQGGALVFSLDTVASAFVASLTSNICVLVITSVCTRQTVDELRQIPRFLKPRDLPNPSGIECSTPVLIADLRNLMVKFVESNIADDQLQDHLKKCGLSGSSSPFATERTLSWAEEFIGGIIGSAMARNSIAALHVTSAHKIKGFHYDNRAIDVLSDSTELLSSNWERFRETLYNINQGILMFDSRLMLSVWNPTAIQLLGLSNATLSAGASFNSVMRSGTNSMELDSARAELALAVDRLNKSQPECQIRHTAPNGQALEIQLKTMPSGGVLIMISDISERQKAEVELQAAYAQLESRVEQRTKELRASEDRFKEMVESSSDWYWETDSAHRFTYISNRFYELTGLRPEQVIGYTRWSLVDTDNRQSGSEIAANKDHMQNEEPFRDIRYTLKTNKGELRIQTSGKPYYSEAGSFLGYRGTASNVTSSEKAEKELIRSERLAALGELVAAIAHEVNTPVGIGLTASTYIQDRTAEFKVLFSSEKIRKTDLSEYIDSVEQLAACLTHNLKRAAQLVKSFKQVAVDQSADQVREFFLKNYLEEISTSVEPKLKHNRHSLHIDCPKDIKVRCNPGALAQIITNLVINSIIHGFEKTTGGNITLAVTLRDTDLLVTYADNGCGISPENMQYLFKPFFTTKRTEGGSGLGLHVIYNLVTQIFGGKIDFTSTPGNGVQVSIILPNLVIETESINHG